MAQKSGLNKLLELIGIYDREDTEPRQERPRYRETSYEDQPRFTPRVNRNPNPARPAQQADNRRARPQEQSRIRSRFGGNAPAQETREMARPNNQKLRPNTSTMVYYLHSLSECSGVIQDLIHGNSVLLNLEETDNALTQRIVDTLAGASFALHAKIRKVSEKMYLIAPENVEVNMTSSVERRY